MGKKGHGHTVNARWTNGARTSKWPLNVNTKGTVTGLGSKTATKGSEGNRKREEISVGKV